MTSDNTENSNAAIEAAAGKAIEDLPISESVRASLAAARSSAMAKAAELEASKVESAKVVSFPTNYSKFLWPSAAAACVSIIAVSFAFQPQNTQFPAEVFEASFNQEAAVDQEIDTQDLGDTALLTVAELDETEWELILDLDFALWLSEQSQDAFADPLNSQIDSSLTGPQS